ncbi:MAG: hypothetical protein RL215_1028 [Planctomycetota bacterium]|jgi:hypothetical protein
MSRGLFRFFLLASCVCGGVLWGCQSPVFRYALERWRPGIWELVIVSSGELSSEQQRGLEQLEEAARDGLPLQVRRIDLGAVGESERRVWEPILERGGAKDGVVAAALYPRSSTVDQPLGCLIPFTSELAGEVISSPVRVELVRRLSAGQSAVWLFVDSGDREADEAAYGRLEEQLRRDVKRLKLPTAKELLVSEEYLRQLRIPLKLEFSVIRLRRDDVRERFLVDCLLNSEDDLRGLGEPLAFPVFGRGRVLYALAGQGISAATIAEASDFLTGACSCEIKEQNPGFDLLLRGDWSSALGERMLSSPIPSEGVSPKLLAIPPGRGSGGESKSRER